MIKCHMARTTRRDPRPRSASADSHETGKQPYRLRSAKPPKAAETRETLIVDPAGQAYVTLLGLRTTHAPDIVHTIQDGLPFATFERFVTNSTLSSLDAAALVNIPVRTLARRKQEGRLQPGEADRLLRASRVLGRAIGLFDGDRSEAKRWLTRPQRAFGGAKPLDLASTEVGALAVERLIDQLEQGVFV